MKKLWNFIVYKWNSFLLSISTLWLAAVYFDLDRHFVGILALLFATVKLIGIFTNHTVMRLVGLVGMNVMWAVTAYYVFRQSATPWELMAFVVAMGIGISLQERFRHE